VADFPEIVAFLVGAFLNSYVMSKMKIQGAAGARNHLNLLHLLLTTEIKATRDVNLTAN
jgi:hypothetical protein